MVRRHHIVGKVLEIFVLAHRILALKSSIHIVEIPQHYTVGQYDEPPFHHVIQHILIIYVIRVDECPVQFAFVRRVLIGQRYESRLIINRLIADPSQIIRIAQHVNIMVVYDIIHCTHYWYVFYV